jgi:hypothetical protein
LAGSAFSEWNGITTNHAEGLNNLLKILCGRNELPLDVVGLIFQKLSVHFCNQIKMGFGQTGNYHLSQEHQSQFVDHRFQSFRDCTEPEKFIVELSSQGYNTDEFLKIAGIKSSTIHQKVDLTSGDSNTDFSDSATDSEIDCSIVSNSKLTNDENENTSKSKSTTICGKSNEATDNSSNDEDDEISASAPSVVESFKKMSINNSRVARAKYFCQHSKVHFNQQLKIYNITDENDIVYMVKVYPGVSIIINSYFKIYIIYV